MSRSQKEAIVMVVDCGQSMSQKSLNCDESVFDLSKECILNIIKQKIFAESKNEYLLIQFGTNDNKSVDNIKINGSLCLANFDLLRFVSQINSTHIQTNVMNALKVSTKVLLESVEGQKFSALKLALFTNFGQFSNEDFDEFKSMVSNDFEVNQIQPIIICDFIPNCDQMQDLSKSQLLGIKAMKLIEEQSMGFCYDLNYANNYFSYFEGKKTASVSWYSKLELGKGVNSLNIPIAAYIKVTPFKRKTGTESYVKTNADSSDDNNISVEQKHKTSSNLTETPIERGVTYRPNNEDSMEELEKEEVISAYSYGSTLVPFNADDKQLFKYESTEKGFKIIGFTSMINISSAHRIGEKTMFVIPDSRPKQSNHKLIFQSLARAMFEKQEVAIVRYGWSDKSSPQIGYLSPIFEEGNVILTYIQLPFDEDVRKYRFPSLESKPQYCPTKPQLEAIDELMDAMDLMNAGQDEDTDSCEALKSEDIYDPFLQYWFQCLYHRQLYQNSNDLPLPSDHLRDTIEPPIKIRTNADKFLRKLSQKFPLDYIKDKTNKKRSQIIANTQQTDETEPKKARINEENSSNSLKIDNIKSEINELIKSEVPFSQVGHELENSIKEFCVDANDIQDFAEQIVELIEIYRKEAILSNEPNVFNDFMKHFMKSLRGTTIWYTMLSHEIGLIGRSECDSSSVSQEEVETFTNLTDDHIKVEAD